MVGGLPKKVCAYKPKGKMMPVQWKKVPNSVVNDKTFWGKAKDADIKKSIPVLEELFSAKTTHERKDQKSGAEDGGGGESLTHSKSSLLLTSLLDVGRSTNVSVSMSSFKIPTEDIIAAVWRIDENVLSVQNVKNILACCPKPEELELLKGYTEPRSTLNKPEQFMLELNDIPAVQERLSCILFKLQYESKIKEIIPELETLVKTAEVLVKSKKWHGVLELILGVCNFLNAGGVRGGFYGFKMESLGALANTRSSQPGVTLLHVFARIIEANYPELLDWAKELDVVEEVHKIALADLRADIGWVSLNASKTKAQVEKYKASGTAKSSDKFLVTFDAFAATAAEKAEALKSRLQEAQDACKKMLEYYGEDKMQPEEFFGLIYSFRLSYAKAVRDNKLAEEQAKRRPAMLTIRPGRSAQPGAALADQTSIQLAQQKLRRVPADGTRGKMDDALNNLKDTARIRAKRQTVRLGAGINPK